VPFNQQGASAFQNSPDAQGAGGVAPSVSNPDIAAYTGQQSPLELQRQVQTLQDFMEESDNTSSLGLVLRESRQRVINGGDIPGLLIVSVISGSPAAAAGLHGYSTAARSALEGAAIAASLFFPPAIIAVAVVDGSRVGESYDMIIGVDSNRVTNFLEFSDQMRDVQPGEIVYLSVLRNGRRVQVPVQIPPPTSGTTAGVPSPLSPTDARAAAAAAAAAAASP
jgi:S1-C subfamily serine protease